MPQLRADKNGKMVTRHVKVDSHSLSSSSFPAPAMKTGAEQHETNLSALLDVVHTSLHTVEYGTTFDKGKLDQELRNLSPSTVEAFRKQIDEQPDYGYEDILISALHNRIGSEDASYILFISQQANNEYGFDNVWDEDLECTYEYERSIKILRGIKQFCSKTGWYDRPLNIFEAEEEPRQRMQTLTTLIKKGNWLGINGLDEDWQTGATVLTDTELGYVAMDYPDEIDLILDLMGNDEQGVLDGKAMRTVLEYRDTEDIDPSRVISIISDRGTSDREAIDQVLNAETQSLSSGAL